MVCQRWNSLDEKWKKIVKFSIISFVVLFSYIFLFAVDADDNTFLITGGAIGFVSSVRRRYFIACKAIYLLTLFPFYYALVDRRVELLDKMGQQRRRLATPDLLALLESSL